MTTVRPVLVTVIIRSLGRASLADALDSAARQTHRNIEILVVDATGGQHPALADHHGPFPLRIVGAGRPLNRPEAANCGLDHARGEWLIFLDDDDGFDPTHIASLVAAASERGFRLAYSGTRLLDESGRVLCELNRAHARLDLFDNNYIQMGAALFHRSLLDLGCRFDETMLLYQDWDFWLQLAMHTGFAHTGAVTNTWRAHSGQSGAGVGPNADPELQARYTLRLREKWAPRERRFTDFLGNAAQHAKWLISHRHAQRAIQLLSFALALSPENPGLNNLLGIALFHAGHLTDAWRVLNEAHRKMPENLAIRRNLDLVERAQSAAEAPSVTPRVTLAAATPSRPR